MGTKSRFSRFLGKLSAERGRCTPRQCRTSTLVRGLVVFLAAACAQADSGARTTSGPRFALLPASETAVTFVNDLPENPVMNGFVYEYYYNGGGVAVGDLTGNGFPDLYFTSNLEDNRLYLNHGEMRFEDVTDRAGVAGRLGHGGAWATGVTFFDVNANGRLDIYVSYSGPFDDPEQRRNMLFINQGTRDGIPYFTEEAAAYGLDDPGRSTQAAFFHGDGDLFMYLLNHDIPNRPMTEIRSEGREYAIDRLYRKVGDRFVDVSAEAGLVGTALGFGLGVSVSDLNNSGRPDIYVANDYFGRDYLYLGQPDGQFEEALERSMGHIPYASMGSDIADIDGDGWLDLAVVEMAMPTHYDRKRAETGTEGERFAELVAEGEYYQYEANALQWNRGARGDGVPVFSEIAHLTGLARTDWSWATLFADLDNSGRPDLFVTTGIASNFIDVDFNDYRRRLAAQADEAEGRITHSLMLELLENQPRRRVPNYVFRNEGDLSFSDRTAEWGLDQPSYSHGAVYADLNRNGALDLVVNNLWGEAFIYRNRGREVDGSHYLAIRFDGPGHNPFGIGTRVRLKAGGAQQVQELQLTRGYQSSVEPVLHFGLGNSAAVDTLEVTWPDGTRQVLSDLTADRYITLSHSEARPQHETVAPGPGLFMDATDDVRPRPRHEATLFAGQPGLRPYPSARDELALAVGDLNGNGLDDFVFGGSAGEAPAIYVQQEDGTFLRTTRVPWSGAPDVQAVAAAVFDATGNGRNDVWIVASDGVGDPALSRTPAYRHKLYLNEGGTPPRFREAADPVPGLTDAGVVLVPSRPAADGSVYLFVGSRTVPGGASTSGSRLLRTHAGTFEDVTAEVAPVLAELRTVTDAVWADVNGNGADDLVVVGEWMPVTLLLNEGGVLRDATAAAGLGRLTGWWQSIAAVDLRGTGRVDLVAGNMGLNYPYRPSADAPLRVYIHDFDDDGSRELVPAYYEGGTLYPWYGRTLMAWELPFLLRRFPTHSAFARAGLRDIFGAEQLDAAERFEAATFATVLLQNDGAGRFRATPLPRNAQLSPVTGIIAADFTRNGVLDLVLAGNIDELDANTPKADAGVGVLLTGTGEDEGLFQPMMPAESGLLLQGRVRRLAAVRGSADGRPGILAAVVGGDLVYVRAAAAPTLTAAADPREAGR